MRLLQPFLTNRNPVSQTIDFFSRTARGKRHLPPVWLRDVGPSNFEATGQEFLRYFIELAGLKPVERVLDIGCGSGRMALPLTGYFTRAGSYVGLDVTRSSIVWCRQQITSRFSNFQFLHSDLYNLRYNPQGRLEAKDYVFPLSSASFDFIFLTSVFTHLLPEDTAQYLREIARLLQPDGRCLATFFLLNEAQEAFAKQGLNDINFQYGPGPHRLRDKAIPESAVAYQETYLSKLLDTCGLTPVLPIYYGQWSGRSDGLSYQDILLLKRRNDLTDVSST